MEEEKISRSISRASWNLEEVFGSGSHSRKSNHADEDEEALRWAALEKLPTYARLQMSIIKSFVESGDRESMVVHKEIDVRNLDLNDRTQLFDSLFRVVEEDNEKFLKKFRNRIERVGIEWTAQKFFWFFFIIYISFLYFTYYGMMTVSLTPNQQVAAIFASAFYSLFNIFSGFFIPRPRIPKWWIWYYWICPLAWTVYGLIVSQYGDVEETIKVPGVSPDPSVKWYLEHHFGFKPNFIGPVAGVLVGFAVFFAFIYAYCIKTLNFQVR